MSLYQRACRVIPGGVSSPVRAFGSVGGDPVFIAREHWEPVAASLSGDRGARRYLVENSVSEIECGDLWNGLDRDLG